VSIYKVLSEEMSTLLLWFKYYKLWFKYSNETSISTLCSTLGKKEEETSWDEANSWVWDGSETTCKTDYKTFDEIVRGEMKRERP
jgi:hypothetical protein